MRWVEVMTGHQGLATASPVRLPFRDRRGHVETQSRSSNPPLAVGNPTRFSVTHSMQ
jgi:hypothetical protein